MDMLATGAKLRHNHNIFGAKVYESDFLSVILVITDILHNNMFTYFYHNISLRDSAKISLKRQTLFQHYLT